MPSLWRTWAEYCSPPKRSSAIEPGILRFASIATECPQWQDQQKRPAAGRGCRERRLGPLDPGGQEVAIGSKARLTRQAALGSPPRTGFSHHHPLAYSAAARGKCLAQRGDVNLQGVFLNHQAGPDRVKQTILADHLVRLAQERGRPFLGGRPRAAGLPPALSDRLPGAVPAAGRAGFGCLNGTR
jgi:hypothetical protein